MMTARERARQRWFGRQGGYLVPPNAALWILETQIEMFVKALDVDDRRELAETLARIAAKLPPKE